MGDARSHLIDRVRAQRERRFGERRSPRSSRADRGSPPLAGRRAIVTGGGSGIGRATARRLAAEGAAVAINYPADPGRAEELAGEITATGGTGIAVRADVSVENEVVSMVQEARSALGGPPDLLVNNAGVEKPARLVDMSVGDWNRILGVNLTGAFLCAREVARGLVETEEPGVIVNVSSVHEEIPWPGFGHYCASKAGLKLFAQTISRELAPHGIRVVQVAPGAIATPINESMLNDEEETRAVVAEIPLGRIGHADEVATAVAWAAGPEASYVTGSTIFVDGGMTTYPKFV